MHKILTAILIVSVVGACYAQNEDEITLTTYYPAPYGEYDSLRSDKIAVGNGAATVVDSGVLQFEKLATPPSHAVNKEGAIYYDARSSHKEFKFNNGSDWQGLGGGGFTPTQGGWIAGGGATKADETNLGQGWKVVILMGSAVDAGPDTLPIGGFIYDDGTGYKASLYYASGSFEFPVTLSYQGWYETTSGGRRDLAVKKDGNGDIWLAVGRYSYGVSYLILK